MPYQLAPTNADIDDTIVICCDEAGWARCKCGNRFFFIEEAEMAVLVAYCHKCKKQYRLILGVTVDITC